MQEVEQVKDLLGLDDILDVFLRRPLLLSGPDVEKALTDLTDILPPKYDPKKMLLEMPSLIYSENRKCLPSQLVF
jgi:hypothetical protein